MVKYSYFYKKQIYMCTMHGVTSLAQEDVCQGYSNNKRELARKFINFTLTETGLGPNLLYVQEIHSVVNFPGTIIRSQKQFLKNAVLSSFSVSESSPP